MNSGRSFASQPARGSAPRSDANRPNGPGSQRRGNTNYYRTVNTNRSADNNVYSNNNGYGNNNNSYGMSSFNGSGLGYSNGGGYNNGYLFGNGFNNQTGNFQQMQVNHQLPLLPFPPLLQSLLPQLFPSPLSLLLPMQTQQSVQPQQIAQAPSCFSGETRLEKECAVEEVEVNIEIDERDDDNDQESGDSIKSNDNAFVSKYSEAPIFEWEYQAACVKQSRPVVAASLMPSKFSPFVVSTLPDPLPHEELVRQGLATTTAPKSKKRGRAEMEKDNGGADKVQHADKKARVDQTVAPSAALSARTESFESRTLSASSSITSNTSHASSAETAATSPPQSATTSPPSASTSTFPTSKFAPPKKSNPPRPPPNKASSHHRIRPSEVSRSLLS